MVKKQCNMCGKELYSTKDNFIYSSNTKISNKNIVVGYEGICYCAMCGNIWMSFEKWLKNWIKNGSDNSDLIYMELEKIKNKTDRIEIDN